MEELTIEQKAERYDEILVRAKGANLLYYKDVIMSKVKEFVDYLLPELKENEGGKLMKGLISFLKEEEAKSDITSERSELLCKYITWLEDKVPPVHSDEKMINGIIKYLEQSQFGEEHYCIDDDIVRDYLAWLEELRDNHSEDERIIKALKEGFKYHQLFNPTFGGVSCTEIVKWLETK